jgi:hypothetical protein
MKDVAQAPDHINVTAITINAMESNTFATDRSQAVVITARPESPDASDDTLLIEGEVVADVGSEEDQ